MKMRENEVKRYLAGYIRMLISPAARISALDVKSKLNRVTLTLLVRGLEKACAGDRMLSEALRDSLCGLVSDRSCASSIPEYTFHSEIKVADIVPIFLDRVKFDDDLVNAVNLLVKEIMRVCLDASYVPMFVAYTFLEHMICEFEAFSRIYDKDLNCSKSCMLSSHWCDVRNMMSTVVEPDVSNLFEGEYAKKAEAKALRMSIDIQVAVLDKSDKIIE